MIDVPHSFVNNLWKSSTVFVIQGCKCIDTAPDSRVIHKVTIVDNNVENFGASKTVRKRL